MKIPTQNSLDQATRNGRATTPSSKKKGGRHPASIAFPHHTVNRALDVVTALWKLHTSNPSTILELAAEMNYTPTSKPFQKVISSAYKYGFLKNSWVNNVNKHISISRLGQSIVGPIMGDNPHTSKITAFLTPKIFKDVIDAIKNGPIPPDDVFKNTLLSRYHIPEVSVDACHTIIMKNLVELDLITNVKGEQYIQLDKHPPTTDQPEEGGIEEEQMGSQLETTEQSPQSTPEPDTPSIQSKPKQIFVAHGKNRKPLEQLEKILTTFNVNYKVAVNEPNAGMPISEQVAGLMRDSTSGIFIFTADEKITKEDGQVAWRPSQNVIYELGAASVLYREKIVIFKEEHVSFGSDFSALGYISFEKDSLDAKTSNLMVELINLGFMKLTPT